MNVFVNRREGDGGYTLFDSRVDLFRAGVARHRLHDLVENLALVGRGESIIRTKFTAGTRLVAGRVIHQELVNDNYSCSSNGEDWNGREFAHPVIDRATIRPTELSNSRAILRRSAKIKLALQTAAISAARDSESENSNTMDSLRNSLSKSSQQRPQLRETFEARKG